MAVVDEQVEEQSEEVSEKKWDKTKQEADQYKANLEKVLSEKYELSSKVDKIKGDYEIRIGELEKQIRLNTSSKMDIQELNPNDADIPNLVDQNKKLISELRLVKERQAQLEELARQVQQEREVTKAEKQKAEVIERILTPLDEEFGAKYRSAAKKLADEWVDSGKCHQPTNELDGYHLMRRAYAEVVSKKSVVKETQPTADNGSGSIQLGLGEDIGEGTLAEVKARLIKKLKSK
jgi:hypothetical protein